MNVLLINPPCLHLLGTPEPEILQKEGGIYPPLGLLYVAAYAEDVEGCNVHVLDCLAEEIDHETFPAYLQQVKPDVIGIQVMTFTLIDALLLAKTVRKAFPKARIVFGGPHPTIYPQETVQLPEVDIVIAGEGEYTFAELLKALQHRCTPENVSGVFTRNNFQRPVTWQHINDLNELKMPARHLCDTNKYTSPLARKNPITTMMSSRGCPGRCIFCDRPQMGKTFRSRSALSVFREMRYCKEELGIQEIIFYDDTFTINRQRVLDICELIITNGLNIYWDIRARIDTMTPEMISKLREAGCHRIHYGIEAGSPRIQKRLRKPIDFNNAKKIFAFSRKEGIETLGYFMIGCPDEAKEDLKKTFELLRSLPMDYANIGIFTPYPGTEIYQEALESGVYENDYWREFANNPTRDFMPRYWNQYFSDEELLQYMKQAYKHFYTRPGYLLQRIMRLRSFDELKRKAILGIKLLKSVL